MNSFVSSFPGTEAQQILLHDVTTIPNYSPVTTVVSGYEFYSERALTLARRQDIVCLSHPIESAYIRFLRKQGFDVNPENILVVSSRGSASFSNGLAERVLSNKRALDTLVERIDRDRPSCMNVFFLSENEHLLAGVLERRTGRKITVLGGDFRTVRKVYSKEVVLCEAEKRGIPVSPGEVVRLDETCSRVGGDVRKIAAAIKRQIGVTGRVIIRGSVGTSGSSVYLFDTCDYTCIERKMGNPLRARENRTYLVDPCFEPFVSPNILIYVQPGTGRVVPVCASDQCLDERKVHTGNVFPSKAKNLRAMIRDALELSRWLRGLGYTGYAGFDFVEYEDKNEGGTRYFLAELNPRVNGALYPWTVQKRCRMAGDTGSTKPSSFLSANVATTAGSFAEVGARFGDFFYDPFLKKGVFPYNTGRLRHTGHCSAVFLGGGREEVEDMAREFEARAQR